MLYKMTYIQYEVPDPLLFIETELPLRLLKQFLIHIEKEQQGVLEDLGITKSHEMYFFDYFFNSTDIKRLFDYKGIMINRTLENRKYNKTIDIFSVTQSYYNQCYFDEIEYKLLEEKKFIVECLTKFYLQLLEQKLVVQSI